MKCKFCSQNAQYHDPLTGDSLCPVHARVQVVGPRLARPAPAYDVRPATPDDVPHILQLARHFWGETEVKAFGHSYELAATPALLAWSLPASASGQAKPIGAVSYALEPDRALLVALYVLPAYQGSGVASQLVRRLCHVARQGGRLQVAVATTNDNLPALALYQRLGFRLTDLRSQALVEHHGGREEAGFHGLPVRDELQMTLDLVSLPAETPRPDPALQPRVGLVLSGGAVRGFAHLGVLEVLDEAGIRPHCVVGVSAGSVAGALYCAGVPPRTALERSRDLAWTHLGKVVRPKLGFFDIERLPQYLDDHYLHGCTFDQLHIPFAALAADLATGEEVVLREGSVAQAVRASCAVPGVFTPAEQGGRLLVDGGVVNNLPVSVARAMGAEYVIAVDLLPAGQRVEPPHNIFEMWAVTFYMMRRAVYAESHQADCLISPDVGQTSLVDFAVREELFARGREAASREVERIRRTLGLAP
ncbi:MAG: GNAT family N-acetyltransferase [Chloroflexi bacterium]|nr:GNAT family N-acetyltransferase [Chloroflexota bacterium]